MECKKVNIYTPPFTIKEASFKKMMYDKHKQEMLYYLAKKSNSYKVPLEQSIPIVMQESILQENAVSRSGALGLMQVMPYVGLKLCRMNRTELKNYRNNIICGLKVIKDNKNRLLASDFDYLFAPAYNAGITHVNRYIYKEKQAEVPFSQTKEYYRIVLGTQKRYFKRIPNIVINENKADFLGEKFKLKKFDKFKKGRYQLSTYVDKQWTSSSNLRVYNIFPLDKVGLPNSLYGLKKLPAYSFKEANKEFKEVYSHDIPVISAFREPNHNKYVGGAHSSNHIEGASIDVDFIKLKTISKIRYVTKCLERHGFKPLKDIKYNKHGRWQSEDNHFDYVSEAGKDKKLKPLYILTPSNFKTKYDYRRVQFLLDICRLRGHNYINIVIS